VAFIPGKAVGIMGATVDGATVDGANVGGTVVPARESVTFGSPVVVVVVVSVAFASVTFNFFSFPAWKPLSASPATASTGVSQLSPVSDAGQSHPPSMQAPGPQLTPKHASERTQYASSGCAAQYSSMAFAFFCVQSTGLLHAKSPGGGGVSAVVADARKISRCTAASAPRRPFGGARRPSNAGGP